MSKSIIQIPPESVGSSPPRQVHYSLHHGVDYSTFNIVNTLINLNEKEIYLLNEKILLNLTNPQLRNIYTHHTVNLPLINRIREIDRKYFKDNITTLDRINFWKLMDKNMETLIYNKL